MPSRPSQFLEIVNNSFASTPYLCKPTNQSSKPRPPSLLALNTLGHSTPDLITIRQQRATSQIVKISICAAEASTDSQNQKIENSHKIRTRKFGVQGSPHPLLVLMSSLLCSSSPICPSIIFYLITGFL